MIFTTIKEKGVTRCSFFAGGEPAEMPWLTYWNRLLHNGDRLEKQTANRVSRLVAFRVFNWEPEAAEKVLAYIATGSWSSEKRSGLLGPDGEEL